MKPYAFPRLDDTLYMNLALALARRAMLDDEVPVGALVVLGGKVLGFGWNQKEAGFDPTAHAEIVALRMACRTKGNWRLSGACVYVTKEPCVMCAGALLEARVARVVYGAKDLKTGALGSLYCLHDQPFLPHRLAISEGVEEDRAAELLVRFFRCKKNR
jgi:tRNA(adenine34) deaminase